MRVSELADWTAWSEPGEGQLVYDAAIDGFVIDGRVRVNRAGATTALPRHDETLVRAAALGKARVVAPGDGRLPARLRRARRVPSGQTFVAFDQLGSEQNRGCGRSRAFALTLIADDQMSGTQFVSSSAFEVFTFLADGTLVTDSFVASTRYAVGQPPQWEPREGGHASVVTITPSGDVEPLRRALLQNVVAAGDDRVWGIEVKWRRRTLLGLTRAGQVFFRRRLRDEVLLPMPYRDGVCVRTPQQVRCFSDDTQETFSLPVRTADRVLTALDGSVYAAASDAVTEYRAGRRSWSADVPDVASDLAVTSQGELCFVARSPLRLACLASRR